ncbi:PIG-L family deacetylase [Paenibacillus lemnae]|uniref:PIG-L family deacetylase n=1 Tax=Paenibacillus lemnae TaxID=1330551 RepID=A0A848MBD4_PAELE|nr:PIG-L family deacetylase [Paenibacillus lemnae]NMO97549.1 PIG-L family deacetylase [Paenibacillus lemnae]
MAVNLFFIPHQDDEALTFGAGIRNHLDAGDECHVILYTNGAASGVRRQLNGEEKSALFKQWLSPAAEGYSELSEDAFSACRNDEFMRSCRALGLPDEWIHISSYLMHDGTTTVEGCKQVIKEYLERYPGARVKTFTYIGGNHRDHANMGKAGQSMYEQGNITDLRFYVEPYNLRNATKEKGRGAILKEKSVQNPNKVRDSLKEYKKWDPAQGQFAIGYHSVKKCINTVIAKPVSYYHKP